MKDITWWWFIILFPSWQKTYAGKNKTSHFSWMETDLNRQLWLLQVIETARKFYKQKLGWAGRLMCFSCTILKYKTIESLMVMDIFVNIYLGTFMLYITQQIKYRKNNFTKLDPIEDVYIVYLFSFHLLEIHLRLIILFYEDNEPTYFLCYGRVTLNKIYWTN